MTNKIRYWRRLKDMTQIQLAKKIGCSHSWVYMLEKNYYQPDQAMKEKLAIVLQVSERELFGKNQDDFALNQVSF